jgi:hypothetical protein
MAPPSAGKEMTMKNDPMISSPAVTTRPSGLRRALGALRERFARPPRDVVEVGAVVRVFAVDALRETTLVLAPAGSEATPGMVPADSPLGAALHGGRVGETLRWDTPSGPKRLQVVNIVGHMPESAWRSPTESRRAPSQDSAPARRAGAAPLAEAA